jgi:hypothetical protein
VISSPARIGAMATTRAHAAEPSGSTPPSISLFGAHEWLIQRVWSTMSKYHSSSSHSEYRSSRSSASAFHGIPSTSASTSPAAKSRVATTP